MHCITTIKQEMKKRMLTGKKTKFTPEEKEERIKMKQSERDEYERNNLNGFRLIYPCE
jgi:tubulin polyglutamylase TTLL6/13